MGQNFNRALSLMKLSFLDNSLLMKLVGIFTAIFLCGLLISISPAGSSNMHAGNVQISFIYLSMVALVSTLNYAQYKNKLNISTTQALPASINEKFFTPFFVSFILIAVLSSILYLAWTIFTLVINDVQFSYADVVVAFNIYSVGYLILRIAFIHALCCFFSILFTGGTIMVCCFIGIIWPAGIGRINSFMDPDFQLFLSSLPQYFWNSSIIITTLILWIATYYMFKKLQPKR